VSGFIEWSPKIKSIEEVWIQRIREHAKKSGFVPIETAAVEYLETLQLKGEIDKEIYCLSKLGSTSTKELALHYDLTIPLARYVTENFSKIAFPFKRYQIQKVWRGERPQFGRYREFYQADIDVIDSENLSGFYDAEVLSVGVNALRQLKVGQFQVGVSNRKIYEGYLRALGLTETVPVLRIIDKLDKIGLEGVTKALVDSCKISQSLAQKCLALASISYEDQKLTQIPYLLGVQDSTLEQGLKELESLMSDIVALEGPSILKLVKPHFSFVRGFDYYTGTIFEGQFLGNATHGNTTYGSICSGGRYDNLTQGFGNRKLPGVGFSLGLTRILAYYEGQAEQLEDYPHAPIDCACLFVGEIQDQGTMVSLARSLKDQGFSVTQIPVSKLKKGLQIASRLEAGLALFLFEDKIMMKNLKTGDQQEYENSVEKLRYFLQLSDSKGKSTESPGIKK
jgi:histidyl-tRNA synthetase